MRHQNPAWSGRQDMEFHAFRTCCVLSIAYHGFGIRGLWVDEKGEYPSVGY